MRETRFINLIYFNEVIYEQYGFPCGSAVKNLPVMQEPQERQDGSLGWEDPLQEETATHTSVLAWKIP